MPSNYVVTRPFKIKDIEFKPGDRIENPESWLREGKFVELIESNETLLLDDSSDVTVNL